MTNNDSFKTKDQFTIKNKQYTFFNIGRAEKNGLGNVDELPYCLRVLLENALRKEDGKNVKKDTIKAFASWIKKAHGSEEISFFPTRVMMHDVSGIPLLADLAAMREKMAQSRKNPELLNPIRPVDFIMDHSVIVDFAGQKDALSKNMAAEYVRNEERYRVAKWAKNAFKNMHIIQPGQGICHQINLETLARVIWSEEDKDHGLTAFPDSLIACDSHTPMINALSVLGWGVGGIEALSAMLGEPISLIMPDVIGVRVVGKPKEGTTTTDLVLALTSMLRGQNVVQKFTEFFGPGLDALSLPERATLANMAPEYGASISFFPADNETLNYLKLTGREDQIPLVESYSKIQGLWRDDSFERTYSDILEFDLGNVEASLAGPKLPQTQMPLSKAHLSALETISQTIKSRPDAEPVDEATTITDGDIVIAAITSCTNTSNPMVMVAAGLLAKKARAKGLQSQPWVKTSLSPGSRVVVDYLNNAGLLEPLEELGFHVTGYGCMTCCGGSGKLDENISRSIQKSHLNVAAVLSGNRNFEGRIHPDVKLAYLGSPPLVVAYSLLGSITKDITSKSLGNDLEGKPVFLRDIWPNSKEIQEIIFEYIKPELFVRAREFSNQADPLWSQLSSIDTTAYSWDKESTYILKPPFLEKIEKNTSTNDINNAAILAILGDNVTTDHISPGSQISLESQAGKYLSSKGVKAQNFSSYLQRRVNHEVMIRGTFDNIHIQNEITPATKGGWTIHQPSRKLMTIFEAQNRYRSEKRPLVVIAGKEYGTGSSRDWAAKGPYLLGVKAIIAESFERIHRSNLVGMGILPLEFQHGENRKTLKLDGTESVTIMISSGELRPKKKINVDFTKPNGDVKSVKFLCRLDTINELSWFISGGVMPYILEKLSRDPITESISN
ncbi:MAG: aconitate hydratase AcnA [Rhodospirillaceae bacterium]|nr:aconitate hydratase AcnA [Rhodospirillaceae bacterium]